MEDTLPRGPLLSFQSQQALKNLGANLQIARLRRGESESLAAQRTGVSRHTWRRLEAGEPSVSLGLMFEALVVYGFTEQLFQLADPDLDIEGKAQDAARRPKKGRTTL